MDDTKLKLEDLISPSRELSNGGLGVVVALLVRWQIIFRVRLADRQSSCNLFDPQQAHTDPQSHLS